MKYKAIFLDDSQFEALPYRDMGDKVGVADPKTKTAYARKSGIPIIDAFNIMHELEHLEDGHEGVHADHFDPEHGVYYKGFGNMFSSMGQGFSNMGGAVQRGVSNMGQGLQSLFKPGVAQASTGSSGGMGGYFDQPFAKAGGPGAVRTLQAPRGSQTVGNPLWPTTGNAPGNMSSSSGANKNAFDRFFPAAQTAIGALMPKGGFSSPNFSSMSRGGGGQPTPPPTPSMVAPQAPTPTPKPNSNPLSTMFGENTNIAQLGAGTALAGFGQLASPKVKMPNLMELPSVQALSQKNFGSFQELDPELIAAIDRDYDMIDARERDRLIATYKSLRPGADIESDSSFRRDFAELQDAQGKRRVDSKAKHRFEYISRQLQLSELELSHLTELANLDIATIMAQLGIDSQAANDFKQAFSDIGTTMVSSGLGVNQPTGEIE